MSKKQCVSRGRPPILFKNFYDWKRVWDVLRDDPLLSVIAACKTVVLVNKPEFVLDLNNQIIELKRCNDFETVRARYNEAKKMRRDPIVAAAWDKLSFDLDKPRVSRARPVRMV